MDFLIQNGIDPQKCEELCRECKGTSYEYGGIREDYHSFCMNHDHEQTAFDKFLTLNNYYEETYIREQFIEGQNLFAEYQKQQIGEIE